MFDESRFNEIYEKYSHRVIRYCLARLSNDRVMAEEAASDVFMVLFRKWDETDVDGNIGAWLIRSADYCIMHQREKYGRYYGRIEALEDEELCRIHDPTASADSALAAKDALERVERALPDKYVELFRLRNIEGLTMAQVARRLGANYTTIKFRYKRLDAILDRIEEKIRSGEL